MSYDPKVTHAACEKKATAFHARVPMALKIFNTIILGFTPITLKRIYGTQELTFSLVMI
jgi:hypothetical protein